MYRRVARQKVISAYALLPESIISAESCFRQKGIRETPSLFCRNVWILSKIDAGYSKRKRNIHILEKYKVVCLCPFAGNNTLQCLSFPAEGHRYLRLSARHPTTYTLVLENKVGSG